MLIVFKRAELNWNENNGLQNIVKTIVQPVIRNLYFEMW